MKRYRIERVELPTSTPGSWYDNDADPVTGLICKTLELPNKNNQRNISCIPYTAEIEMIYILKKMNPGFGRDYPYFRFQNVPGRTINRQLGMSSILVHPAGEIYDILGCIGVGSRHTDKDKDGIPDFNYADSKKKLQWMVENLPDVFELEITKKIITQ